MEKRKPHYDLLTVQSAVRLRGADAFTATALIGAQAMGLEIARAIEVVCSMSRSDFYKSMTTPMHQVKFGRMSTTPRRVAG